MCSIERSIKHLFHLPSQANKPFITACAKTDNQKIKCYHYSIACTEDQGLCHDILQFLYKAGSAKCYRQRQKSNSSTLHHSDLRGICPPPRM